MLYLFTGNTPFLIQEALKKWKYQFIEKYGDFNFFHIRELENISTNILAEHLFGGSFLAEKKLIIIDVSNDIKEEKEHFLLDNLQNIPDENIVIFHFPEPDKRKKLFKELKKQSESKEFHIQNEDDVYNFLSKKYTGKISAGAIKCIMRYKGLNSEKIVSEINKLLITIPYIEEQDIINNIFPELEESIFQIIDDILNLRVVKSLEKIDTILYNTNIYAFYNNLLANLRTSIFIMRLKDMHIPNQNISKLLDLKNRSFLVNKNYHISFSQFKELYIGLINIDKKMKSGKLLGSNNEDFQLEIEKQILHLKK